MTTKLTRNGLTIHLTPRYSMGYHDGYRVYGTYPNGDTTEERFYGLQNHSYYGPTGFRSDYALNDIADRYIDYLESVNKFIRGD